MDAESPIDLLRRETRVRYGQVPRRIGPYELLLDSDVLEGDEYAMWTPFGLAFHYRKGEGVTVEREPDADASTELLYRNGSVYAAVAAINGFVPMHASAVALDGRVHAFTGPSGAGKSTLSAGLGRRGLALFCDDTLILDISDPDRPMCLPGHKRLKLWPDALELAGATAGERVAHDLEKFFAEPAAGSVEEMLPLEELVFLEEGEPMRIEPIRGAAKLLRFQDDHYTQAMYIAAVRPDRGTRFLQLAQLAKSMKVSRFVRPRDRQQFTVGLDMVADHVRTNGGN